MSKLDPIIKLEDAIKFFDGNQSKLGEAIGASRQLVSIWKNSDSDFLPPLYAYRFIAIKEIREGNPSVN